MGKFRYKRSVPLDHEQQRRIYLHSRRYRSLPLAQRKRIDALCCRAGGEYAEALKEFVTTDRGATEVCGKHFISKSTLVRIVKRYYMEFSETM